MKYSDGIIVFWGSLLLVSCESKFKTSSSIFGEEGSGVNEISEGNKDVVEENKEVVNESTDTVPEAEPAQQFFANVGENISVSESEFVTLTGNEGPPGSLYNWTQTKGTEIELLDPDKFEARFLAPNLTADEVLEFEFSLVDPITEKASKDLLEVTILASNDSPEITSVSSDRNVLPNTLIDLVASAEDPEGEELSYSWSMTSGSATPQGSLTQAAVQFMSPGSGGNLTFEVVVTDTVGAEASGSVNIGVFEPPRLVSFEPSSPFQHIYPGEDFSYELTFNKPVEGVSSSRFLLSGDSSLLTSTVQVTGGPQNYNVTVSSADDNGSMALSFSDNGVITAVDSGFTLEPIVENTDIEVKTPDLTVSYFEHRTLFIDGHEMRFLETVDYDEDNDDDILGFIDAWGEVGFLENAGAGQLYWRKLASASARMTIATTCDVNGDGKIDVVGFTGGSVVWFEQVSTSKSIMHKFDVDVEGESQDLTCIDLDKDGKTDVLTLDANTHKVHWHRNIGNNVFSQSSLTDYTIHRPYGIDAGDFDNDGDNDVVTVGIALGDVILHVNDGSQNFTQTVAYNDSAGSVYVDFVDIDKDNDLDITYVNTFTSSSYLLHNDGGSWARIPIATNMSNQSLIYPYDYNQDNRIDFLIPGGSSNNLNVFQQDEPIGFTYTGLIDNFVGQFAVGQFSGDANIDFLYVTRGSFSEDEFKLVEGDGVGSVSSTTNTILQWPDSGRGIDAGDLDLDGDIDFAVGSYFDDTVAWYENDGSGNFMYHELTSSRDVVNSLRLYDIDDDNDLDIFATAAGSSETVFWFENLTGGSFSSLKQIGNRIISDDIAFGDINGDDRPDIIVGETSGASVPYFSFSGTSFGAESSLGGGINGSDSVATGHLNGDTLVDVISGSFDTGRIGIHLNQGGASFSSASLNTNLNEVTALAIADLNADGHRDIIAGGENGANWYEHDGSQNYTQRSLFSNSSCDARRVVPADMDNDGDLDVVIACFNGNKLHISFNQGSGVLLTKVILTDFAKIEDLVVVDVDNDSKPDIISTTWNDAGIFLHRNLLP